MTRKEQLEQELFILDMKDHHTPEDAARRDELVKRIKELKDNESANIF